MRYKQMEAIRSSRSRQIQRWCICVLAGASAMTAADAQDSDSVIVQIPGAAAISSPSTQQLSPSRLDGGPSTQAVGQLATDPARARNSVRSAPAQLTREGREVRSVDQLYRGGRSAQGAEPLSRPSDGRTGAVARVGGSDRCDRAQTDPAVIRACASAIETRPGEFAKPQAVSLSPEQRLLVDQPSPDGQDTNRTASRRLAGEGQAETLEEQSVASVALRQGNPVGRPTAPDAASLPVLSAEAQAFVNALVGSFATPPPRP